MGFTGDARERQKKVSRGATNKSGLLTDAGVKKLKAESKKYYERETTGDPETRGFCVRVTPNGTKAFCIAYTMDGQRKEFTLGIYGDEYKLSQARTDCKKARAMISDGKDPRVEREKREAAERAERQRLAAEARATTVEQLLDYYINQKLTNPSSQAVARDVLGRDVIPKIGKVKAKDVTDRDIRKIVKTVMGRGAQSVARQLYIYLHSAFNLYKDDFSPVYEEWEINPVSKVTKPEKGAPDRTVLKSEEIMGLWGALERYTGMDEALKDVLRLLLLTGQRVQEVLGMCWSELDLDAGVWTIPPDRLKTGKKRPVEHVLPLTPMVIKILERQPVYVDDEGNRTDQVFPGRDDVHSPYQWRSLGKAVRRLVQQEQLAHFSPRTLRGTVKTGMARIKVMKEIRDRIQNHALTDVADLHYDAHDYLDEKRAGLMKWEQELRRIIGEPAKDNVVELRA